jgi:myosin-crossreactive antigen
LLKIESAYSIRSAQAAVYSLLGLERKAPAVHKGQFNPRVLLQAFLALHEIGVLVRGLAGKRSDS